MINLPGLIDIHVHLRYLDSHKEDFLTSSYAAISGGFTTVIDMPNSTPPITTYEILHEKINRAKEYNRNNLGFHFGSLGDNLSEFEKVKDLVFGLKLYLNQTTGGHIIDEDKLFKIYEAWNKATQGKRPILLHAESDVLPMVTLVLRKTKHPTHICHVSSKNELSEIIKLKEEGLPVTCGVTPHHLFLTEDDTKKLGPYGLMKPSLKSLEDQNFIWENLNFVDLIESDHAPHTKEEKESTNPPFGVPGLETTLPLLLTAAHEGKLEIEDIIRLCHDNPKKIFSIPDDKSILEIDLSEEYEIRNEELFTKCKWSPFNGRKVFGRIKKVTVRDSIVFENGKVLIEKDFGRIIKPL